MTDQHDPAAPTVDPEMGSARTMSAAEREAALAWRPDHAPTAPPRLRTMTLPNGRWIFVLDRLSSHLVEHAVAADLQGFAEKAGAAATAVFAFEISVDDAAREVR